MGQYSWNVGFMKYGTQWRDGRRIFHQFLNTKAVIQFDEYQHKHAHRLLLRLAECPEDFFAHTELLIGALVLEMAYGLDITSKEDRFLRTSMEAVKLMNQVVIPDKFLVNMIPILKYIPEWFPGAGFKAFVRAARETHDVVVDGPLEYVKESMKTGSNNPSIAWSCFDRAVGSTNHEFDEDVIRAATATICLAAVNTTVAVLRTFFLAMTLNPHVVRKAQGELDGVIGNGRLPDFSDQQHLPYVSAVIKEVLRWGCPAPVGLPKQAVEDDIYNGHFIPAGTTIIDNVWAMFYDESLYPDPYTFNPERFLKDGKLDQSVVDPEERTFGWGRRTCPGKHFAMRTLFLNIACILTLFDIEAQVDESVEAKFSEERFVRHPVPFKCTIRLRSEASLELMRSISTTGDC